MSTESHLVLLGVTIQQIQNFISSQLHDKLN